MNRTPDSAVRGAGGRHGVPWRAAGISLVALLALVGAGLIGAGLNAPDPTAPPQPSAAAAPQNPDDESTTAAPQTGAALPPTATPPPGSDLPEVAQTPGAMPTRRSLDRSEPIRIAIPKIDVGATIMPLGVTADGMVQVPPLAKAQLAGWYQLGPAPGEVGNAVIVGHVDSKEIGPAVFFRLGALLPGDTIEVIRKDGKIANFVVEGVKSYPKTAFPTDLVYGPTDVPGLRLITCGGDFDERIGSYPDNIIAFARLAT
ncbi:class F sortase [Plantactinospora sp. S1510]|uniref:Class F sortase n=1 Tax=Plantactinospora alkalitolerans TaxID=2789879 RepID=A0ABS0GY63_9ACTN|nr:class F sortase [Plantactinospora alkalitolerans]MBF9131011.1 class F sortase [Plantactinospora alkalitolerans]